MTITISAENVDDALDKLRRHEPTYGIKIRWRKGDAFDFQDSFQTGCIVNAMGMPGQDVERSFKTAGEALRYIASLLKLVDATSKKQKKEREQKERNAARLKRKINPALDR